MHRKTRLLKLLTVFALVAFVVGGLAACGNKKSASHHKKTITVATSGTLYPTSYHQSSGKKKLVGYDIEVIKAVAKRAGYKLKFKEMSVDSQLTAVKTGKADIAINDYAISPKRKKQYLMSIPIKHSFNSIIVRKSDNSGINSWSDLKGKKAAGEAGTNYQRLAQQLGATLVNYDNVSNDVYLKDVKNGKTDFIMNDYYLQKLALKAYPNSGLKIKSDMYFTTNEDGSGEGIIINKKEKWLQKSINKELRVLKKNGTLKKISKKYYDADVTKKPKVHISKHFTIKSKYTGRN